MDIAKFLAARLDEDEERAAYAQSVIEGDWDGWEPIAHQLPADCDTVPHVGRLDQHLQHNADPARVLREVKAKRAILEDNPRSPLLNMTDQQLHEHWAHPAYEYAKTEGQRKAWDSVDEPPEGDGWERNVDAGRNGWERFDYTEESYWRRLNPDGPQPPYVPKVLCQLAAVYADHPDYDPAWAVS